MKLPTYQPQQSNYLLVFLLLSIIGSSVAQAAPPPLSIKSAVYNKKSASLIVKTHVKDPGGLLTLLHSKGGVLGQTSFSDHTFTIPLAQLGDVPCQVEARVGELKISKAVAGAGAECSKVPVCKMLPFAKGTKPEFNKPFIFEAQVAIKDKKAAPLTIEWDFAGGVLGHPYEKFLKPNTNKPILSGKVKKEAIFVRDNSSYHVRFTAHDTLGRRCEAGVDVVIGQIPNDLPDIKPLAEAAQQSAPARASGLIGETVVLPFEDRSFQSLTDNWAYADTGLNYPIPANSINAYVYQKGLRPAPLGKDKINLTYSAASNPADPVGADSINSTSQNWPLNSPSKSASLRKGEMFERYVRPEGTPLLDTYYSWSLADQLLGNVIYSGFGNLDSHALLPDEGGYADGLSPPVNSDHGRYMPGINNPYSENTPQPFSDFIDKYSWFAANWLPLTDIDDHGRVNPTSLFRIEANDASSQTPLAATEGVLSTTRDFHCRECHALGKIGANPDVQRTFPGGAMPLMWQEAADDSIQEQEYAAMVNATMLHASYDGDMMIGMELMNNLMGVPIYRDGPMTCGGEAGMCHSEPKALDLYQGKIGREADRWNRGSLSNAMHRLHGSLQYNADKSDIQRNSNGRYTCGTVWLKANCTVDPNKSLFPVKDANGATLPMEENCLKCHSGHREQAYRDRMYTAGVTCFQCHGDMLAVAEQFEKPRPNPDGNRYRLAWLDQPDCGSCHTGSGNRSGAGYFSAGVKNLAFDVNDRSATPNAVDLFNPDQRRFAVMPLTALDQNTPDFNPILRTPLFRMGKDDHGQVACPACHGAAHSIWPNRDPNANDNVTALQLQGHAGHLLECNVCHTPDSFTKFEDLDLGLKASNPTPNVLGGPHNLHPINDSYWWKSADSDMENKDHSTSGGWHNNYARLPGMAGEDQCAACHGNDHKGTRLSKTPVDRVFDFSDVADLPLLKKAGIKPKVLVKAGTAIGCNTCHSVELSCSDSPNLNCGKASAQVTGSTHQPPSVNKPYVIDAAIGTDLNYTLSATGDNPVFQLGGGENQITLDSSGALSVSADSIYQWAVDILLAHQDSSPPLRPPFEHDFNAVVTDSSGNYSVQPMKIRFDCSQNLAWDVTNWQCNPLVIIDTPPYGGMNGGSVWHYQVEAISATGLTLSYALADPVPPSMSINSQTGKITWDTSAVAGDFIASVKVNDTAGNQASLDIYWTVCQAPMHWDSTSYSCVGPLHITSAPPQGTNANHFEYQITASLDSGEQPHFTYSIVNASGLYLTSDGITISDTGLISIDPSSLTMGGQDFWTFQIKVSQADNNWAVQQVYLNICPGSNPIWQQNGSCNPSAVSFDTSPEAGVSLNQPYQYQAKVSDSNPDAVISYSLIRPPAGMTIDNTTGLVSWNSKGSEGQPVAYGILASDNMGGFAIQTVSFNVCSAELPIYYPSTASCGGPLHIVSTPPTQGLNVGETFNYQVSAIDSVPNAGAITYSLLSIPPLATIDPVSGQISWQAVDLIDSGGFIFLSVTATDKIGNTETSQPFGLTVCRPPEIWNADVFYCIKPQ